MLAEELFQDINPASVNPLVVALERGYMGPNSVCQLLMVNKEIARLIQFLLNIQRIFGKIYST